MIYRSDSRNVLSLTVTLWYGNHLKHSNKLTQVITRPVSGSMSKTQVYNDTTHALKNTFKLLPCGRRLKVPQGKKNGYKKSFVPSAVNGKMESKIKNLISK